MTHRQRLLFWTCATSSGVDDAPWGKHTGDGDGEITIGMNGDGRLAAVSAEGKKLRAVSRLGNGWIQAIVKARANSPVMIFAIEAGGSIKIFDANGNLARTFRPKGEYLSAVTAVRFNDSSANQGIATGQITVTFDPDEKSSGQPLRRRTKARGERERLRLAMWTSMARAIFGVPRSRRNALIGFNRRRMTCEIKRTAK